MALFKGYLRHKWFATDVTETEWMTLSKVRSAIEDIREEGAATRGELDAIAAFIEQWAAYRA